VKIGDTIYYMWAEDSDEVNHDYEPHHFKSGRHPRLGHLCHWGTTVTLVYTQEVPMQLVETVAIVVDMELGIVREINPTHILTHDSIALNQHRD